MLYTFILCYTMLCLYCTLIIYNSHLLYHFLQRVHWVQDEVQLQINCAPGTPGTEEFFSTKNRYSL